MSNKTNRAQNDFIRCSNLPVFLLCRTMNGVEQGGYNSKVAGAFSSLLSFVSSTDGVCVCSSEIVCQPTHHQHHNTRRLCSIFHLILLMREVTQGRLLFIPRCIRWLLAVVLIWPCSSCSLSLTHISLWCKVWKKNTPAKIRETFKFICHHYEDNLIFVI